MTKLLVRTAICLAAFFFTSAHSFSQENKWRLGIRINPDFSVCSPTKASVLDKKHFKALNFGFGMQLGMAVSYSANKFIFDFHSFLSSRSAGLKFQNFESSGEYYSYLKYRTWGFSSKLFVGYLVKSNDRPMYSIFAGPTLGYDFSGIQTTRGGGNFGLGQVDYYYESKPATNTNLRGFTTGIMLKVRTELKRIGRIDYGISFDYFYTNYPEFEIKAKINGNNYYAKYVPKVNCLSIDFIYYFGGKKQAL